jgi:hypothetical protein
MTSRRAADTRRRLAEATDSLNLLERRLDELEDLIEAAWDDAIARLPRDGEPDRSREERGARQEPRA